MEITVDVRAAEVLQGLSLTQKQVPYAIVNALNETAKAVQAAERARVFSMFHVRKREFIGREVAILKPFASVGQGRFFAKLSVGQKPRLLLPGYEIGAPRPAFKGSAVAVPRTGSAARPSASSSVPEAYTFKGLALRRATASGRSRRVAKRAGVRARKDIYQGAQRTFQLPRTAAHPLGAVFQRVGPGRADLRTLYSFRKVPNLRAVLGFTKTAETLARSQFPLALRVEIDKSITHNVWKGFRTGGSVLR